jgi:hypothetical protein
MEEARVFHMPGLGEKIDMLLDMTSPLSDQCENRNCKQNFGAEIS